jgi:hypothetical protein
MDCLCYSVIDLTEAGIRVFHNVLHSVSSKKFKKTSPKRKR